jgi:hypothetical protein
MLARLRSLDCLRERAASLKDATMLAIATGAETIAAPGDAGSIIEQGEGLG